MFDNKIDNISIRYIVFLYIYKFYNNRPVSSVAKRTLSEREVWGSTPRPVKSAQCRQRLATAAMFPRSCVAQALSRGDESRYTLHASAHYREYNEDLS